MTFLSQEQFIEVCKMQDALNTKTKGADWKIQNLAWDTAVIDEAAEAMNHLGWKWWTPPVEPNIPQTKLEIIDILHFTISGLLVAASDDLEDLYQQLTNAIGDMEPEQVVELNTWNTIDCLKEIIGNSIVNNFGFAVYMSVHAASTLGMSPTDVYNMYIGKNVLNQFRKANGYKEGTYIKMWLGKEDNEYLTQLMTDFTVQGITPTPEKLTVRLTEFYKSVKEYTQE